MSESKVRIFVSSPADVEHERAIVKDIIERLAQEFLPYFRIEPILWEEEALTADRTFQAGLVKPSDCEIVLVVLWTRLGSPLPQEPYAGMTGTEWEFFDAVEAAGAGGPEVLVYRKTNPKLVDITDPRATQAAIEERKRLEDFFQRHFFNPDNTFRRAFRTFDSDAGFRNLVEVQLRKLLNRRIFVERRGPGHAFDWQGSPFRPDGPFRFGDERIFTGREAETRDLLRRLQEQADAGGGFLLLSGASGCGKSSLVRAGLLPRLVRPHQVEGVAACRWCLVEAPADTDPLAALAEALCAGDVLGDPLASLGVEPALLRRSLAAEPALAAGHVRAALAGLNVALREDSGEAEASARLMVVVDPLEPPESPRHAAVFGAALDALARSGAAWVVGVARSDRLGDLPRLAPLAKELEDRAWVRLEPPPPARIRQVIEIPALVAGLEYESERGRSPVEQLEAEAAGLRQWPGFLQGALGRWYQAAQASTEAPGHARALDAAAFRFAGGLADEALRRAEVIWDGLDEAARAALPILCRALLTLEPGPAARPSPRAGDLDVLERDAACRRLIQPLIDAGLVIADGVQDPVVLTPCALQPAGLRALLGRVVPRVRGAGSAGDAAAEPDEARAGDRADGPDWTGYRRTLTLAHPVLIERWAPMRDWLAEAGSRKALAERQRLSRQALLWKRTDCNSEYLLGEAGYAAARRFADRYGAELEPAEAELLAGSEQHLRLQRGRNRLVRVTGLVLAGLLLVATAAAFWALDASRTATLNLEHARLATADLAIVRGNTPRAVALALDAGAYLPGHALQILSRAFTANRLIAMLHEGVPDPEHPLSAAIDASGDRAVTLDPAFGLRRWRLEGFSFEPEGPPRTYEPLFHRVLYAGGAEGDAFYALAPEGLWRLPVTEGSEPDFACGAEPDAITEVSHDGRLLAIGRALAPDRYSVCLLDLVRPGAPRFDAALHDREIVSLAFSRDGSRLLTASRDRTAKVLDTTDGTLLLRMPPEAAPSRPRPMVRGVFDLASGRIALVTTDEKIWIYGPDGSLERGLAEVARPEGPRPVHEADILDIAVSPDGRYLVSVDQDGQVVRWNLADGSALAIGQHEQAVELVRIGPDGRRALTASSDHTARLWDLYSGRQLAVFSHDGPVSDARFSLDGRRAFTRSAQDGSARLWSLEPVSRLARPLPHPDHVVHLAFSAAGGELATASYDGKVRVWDLTKGGEAPKPLELEGHEGPVRRLDYAPDGQRLVSAGQDGTARIWDVRGGQGRERCRLDAAGEGARVRVQRALFDPAPAGRWVLTAAQGGASPLALWDAGTCDRVDGGDALDAPGASAEALAVRAMPDGVLAAAGFADGRVRVLRQGEDGTWRRLCEHTLHGLPVEDLDISPDGSRVASVGEDRWGRVLTVAGCEGETPEIADLAGHADKVRSVRFAPDGRHLVTASMDRTARVWTADGREVQVLAGHKNYVYHADFSPDGRWLLTASRDGTAALWRAPAGDAYPKGDFFLILTADLGGIPFATFSPDGRSVGAGYWGDAAQLWPIWTPADGTVTDGDDLSDFRSSWGGEYAGLVLLRQAERFRRENRLDDLRPEDEAD